MIIFTRPQHVLSNRLSASLQLPAVQNLDSEAARLNALIAFEELD
jgi:hypothetical protein